MLVKRTEPSERISLRKLTLLRAAASLVCGSGMPLPGMKAGVDVAAGLPDFKMQMRSGRTTGIAGEGDNRNPGQPPVPGSLPVGCCAHRD